VSLEDIQTFFASLRRAYDRHDAVAVASHYSDNGIVESPIGGTVVGRAAIETVARVTFAAFPDFTIEHQELLAIDDRIVETSIVSGTDTGGFMGLPPTGKPFQVPAVFLFTMKDGRIVHERRTYDFSGFLLQLAGAAGPAIESARLYRETLERAQLQRDVQIAADIQRALLPAAPYRSATFELAGASIPCRAIGGDFFDYFELRPGECAFALGDVAGKGPPAALLTAVLQGIFAAGARAGRPPAETLTDVNRALVRRRVASRFATVLYGVMADDGRFVYSLAGHNPPFLVRANGVRRLESGGTVLGVFDQVSFAEETVQFTPGDVLMAFSDGITEALNTSGDQFGDDRVLACVLGNRALEPAALVKELFSAIAGFTGGAPQSDDMTALALRYIGA
jgi:phosphoserine phosphatase RsbU/P